MVGMEERRAESRDGATAIHPQRVTIQWKAAVTSWKMWHWS